LLGRGLQEANRPNLFYSYIFTEEEQYKNTNLTVNFSMGI